MKVVVFVKATPSSEAGKPPSEKLMSDMLKYNEQLVEAGIMEAGEGLKPSSEGVRVRFSGADRTVTDGPFAETKELVAGFWVWRVESMEEAVKWVKKCPNPMPEDSEIEIRPLYEMEDFGDEATPELREREAGLRAQTLGLEPPRFEDGHALQIAGLNERYTSETRANIPQQWETFIPQMDAVPDRVGPFSYGVSWKHSADCEFDYLTGVEVTQTSSLPEGYTHLTLKPHRYAVFPFSGPVTGIAQFIDTICNQWIPDAGLEILQEPCFERYTPEFNPAGSPGGMEFWIPLATD